METNLSAKNKGICILLCSLNNRRKGHKNNNFDFIINKIFIPFTAVIGFFSEWFTVFSTINYLSEVPGFLCF